VSRGGDEFDAIDPGVSYREAAWQIISMVYDGLVTLRRTGGSAGATIVPDLAAALPEIQDGGRTYLFRLREGIRYSTGEVVGPEDVRASVERLFRSPNEAGAQLIASHLVGSEGCFQKPRECEASPERAIRRAAEPALGPIGIRPTLSG
jgi:peptide/nickel transport system substrate-binding protein